MQLIYLGMVNSSGCELLLCQFCCRCTCMTVLSCSSNAPAVSALPQAHMYDSTLSIVCDALLLFADNVGDNVGDIAGMGADLFGSFAESTCAALVVAGVSELGANHNWPAMMFPLMISATGIIVCILTTLIATDLKPARHISEIEHTLKMQLIISTVLMTPVSACRKCLQCGEAAVVVC